MNFHLFETPTHWIAEKEMDSTPIDTQGKETSRGLVYFERGMKDGKLVLRRILYSKEMFPTEGEVVHILGELEAKCPLCKAGLPNNENLAEIFLLGGGISLIALVTMAIWIGTWNT